MNCTKTKLFQKAIRETGCSYWQSNKSNKTIQHWSFSENNFRSNHRRRIAPSDQSLIKPSVQNQVTRPELEQPEWSKPFIDSNISLNLEPKGWQDRTKCPFVLWNPRIRTTIEALLKIKWIEMQRIRTFKTRYQETDCQKLKQQKHK